MWGKPEAALSKRCSSCGTPSSKSTFQAMRGLAPCACSVALAAPGDRQRRGSGPAGRGSPCPGGYSNDPGEREGEQPAIFYKYCHTFLYSFSSAPILPRHCLWLRKAWVSFFTLLAHVKMHMILGFGNKACPLIQCLLSYFSWNKQDFFFLTSSCTSANSITFYSVSSAEHFRNYFWFAFLDREIGAWNQLLGENFFIEVSSYGLFLIFVKPVENFNTPVTLSYI